MSSSVFYVFNNSRSGVQGNARDRQVLGYREEPRCLLCANTLLVSDGGNR